MGEFALPDASGDAALVADNCSGSIGTSLVLQAPVSIVHSVQRPAYLNYPDKAEQSFDS
jgi:hypothetical protein